MSEVSLWQGEFGDAYTERNRVDWKSRIPFWASILKLSRARSVLEVGCNAGWNLRALREVDTAIKLRGIDINDRALSEARVAGLDVEHCVGADLKSTDCFDLVLSAGFLIHVPSRDLDQTLRAIIDASKKWVVAVEYDSDVEEEIIYRGNKEMLWKRPFGKLLENLNLSCVQYGILNQSDGFDNCTYWLMTK